MWRRDRNDRPDRGYERDREWRDRFENDYGYDLSRNAQHDRDRNRGQRMPDRADAGSELYRRMHQDRGPFQGYPDEYQRSDRGMSDRDRGSRVERPDFNRDQYGGNPGQPRREFNTGYGRDFDYERDRGEIRSDYRGDHRDRFDFHPGRGFDATPDYNSDRDRDYGFRGGDQRPRTWDWDRDRDRERERHDADFGTEEWYRDRWRR